MSASPGPDHRDPDAPRSLRARLLDHFVVSEIRHTIFALKVAAVAFAVIAIISAVALTDWDRLMSGEGSSSETAETAPVPSTSRSLEEIRAEHRALLDEADRQLNMADEARKSSEAAAGRTTPAVQTPNLAPGP